ncbi:hypothetical protein SynA1560_00848 [Synechococcus sp. A15-60]|nr:hypothetical protein SynA1560_00848 [Synechococcus sp. A15-60]
MGSTHRYKLNATHWAWGDALSSELHEQPLSTIHRTAFAADRARRLMGGATRTILHAEQLDG